MRLDPMAWTAQQVFRTDLPARDQIRSSHARAPVAGDPLGLAAVRDAITDGWMGTVGIAVRAGLSRRYTRDMLKLLAERGEVEMRRAGNNFEWRRA
ncbi:MAG: hypothetical protein NUV51_01115 [Sulfuricaulis sp.]|nr:hypothetical protein [Sulfuricaulis sp.]